MFKKIFLFSIYLLFLLQPVFLSAQQEVETQFIVETEQQERDEAINDLLELFQALYAAQLEGVSVHCNQIKEFLLMPFTCRELLIKSRYDFLKENGDKIKPIIDVLGKTFVISVLEFDQQEAVLWLNKHDEISLKSLSQWLTVERMEGVRKNIFVKEYGRATDVICHAVATTLRRICCSL